MQRHMLLLLLLCVPSAYVNSQSPSLSQRQACKQFSSAVVRIDAGGESSGSGFIVSPDGLILTASHVVRHMDEDGSYFAVILIHLPTGESVLAKPVMPLSLDSVAQDFALLRVETKTALPFLTLGSVGDVEIGGDATIIGYPFSAVSREGKSISTKFCVSASFAATGSETIPMNGKNRTAKGVVPIQKNVQVDVVYFQGPSVKGISGSPIIARDTGKVVGIVTTKLSGIGNSLEELKAQTAKGLGSGISLSGLDPGPVINSILTVMDDQLANGMGSATGIDDPKEAMRKEQNKKKK